MHDQPRDRGTDQADRPISGRYQAWLAALRSLTRLIRRERRLGRKDEDLSVLCKPFLEEVNRVYAELKAESRFRSKK